MAELPTASHVYEARMKKMDSALNWPLIYTYHTRLKTYRGLLDFAVRDVLIVIAVASAAFDTSWLLMLVAYVGHLALYECGYLINDSSESAKEPGGGRLKETVEQRRFWMLRLAVLGVAAAMLWLGAGAAVMAQYVGWSFAVLGLLLVHTRLSDYEYWRIFSFAWLALFKYAPVVVPLIGWSNAQPVLIAVFLCYGMPRVLIYTLRKFGSQSVQATIESRGSTFQVLTLLLLAPFLWQTPAGEVTHLGAVLQLTWSFYATVWVASNLARWVRRRSLSRAF